MRDYRSIFLNSRISRISISLIILVIVAYGIHIQTTNRSIERPNRDFVRLTQAMPEEELTEETFPGKDQEDPNLVTYIQQNVIYGPSTLPYNLTNPDRRDFSQYKQSDYAEENFLHGMTGGFFVEAGALDGEDKSNSLYFEKYRGWKGLLVEPDPSLFRHLSLLHRKAYAVNAGFSLNNVSGTASFVPKRGLGKIKNSPNGIKINVFPFYSMLLALGVTQVDFFSLDIEGSEKSVLNTIPWDKIKFRLICMEINKYKGGPSAYIKFFQDRGYTFLGHQRIDAWFGLRNLLQETMDVDDWLTKNKEKIGL